MPLTDQIEMARPFEDAGFTPPQAHALAGLTSAIDQRFDSVDARLDGVESSVRELRSETRTRLGSLETEMRTRFEGVERELRSLPWKLLTVMLTVAALVIAAQKFL